MHGQEQQMVAGSGVSQGDSIAPDAFSRIFNDHLTPWQEFCKKQNPSLVAASVTDSCQELYLGNTLFVDDIGSLNISENNNMQQLWNKAKKSSQKLDACLRHLGACRNLDKEEQLVRLPVGFPQAATTWRQVLQEKDKLKKSSLQARYLGPHLDVKGRYSKERHRRISTAERNWNMFGGFWQLSSPKRVRLLVFRAVYTSALFAASNAFVLEASDHAAYNSRLCKRIRCLMKGAATVKTVDADGNVSHKSLTNFCVLKWARQLPSEYETCVSRLRFWRNMLVDPENHAVFLTVVLSPQLGFEREQLDNPWCMQLRRDIEVAKVCDMGVDLHERLVNNSLLLLVSCEETRLLFCSIDFNEIKAWYFSSERDVTASAFADPFDAYDYDAFPFVCTDLDENNLICGMRFATIKGLQSHRRQASGGQHGGTFLASFVVTNECPACVSAFASRRSACQHFKGSCSRGHCIPDKGYMHKQVMKASDQLVCPHCDEVFQDEGSGLHVALYYRHIRKHIQVPDIKCSKCKRAFGGTNAREQYDHHVCAPGSSSQRGTVSGRRVTPAVVTADVQCSTRQHQEAGRGWRRVREEAVEGDQRCGRIQRGLVEATGDGRQRQGAGVSDCSSGVVSGAGSQSRSTGVSRDSCVPVQQGAGQAVDSAVSGDYHPVRRNAESNVASGARGIVLSASVPLARIHRSAATEGRTRGGGAQETTRERGDGVAFESQGSRPPRRKVHFDAHAWAACEDIPLIDLPSCVADAMGGDCSGSRCTSGSAVHEAPVRRVQGSDETGERPQGATREKDRNDDRQREGQRQGQRQVANSAASAAVSADGQGRTTLHGRNEDERRVHAALAARGLCDMNVSRLLPISEAEEATADDFLLDRDCVAVSSSSKQWSSPAVRVRFVPAASNDNSNTENATAEASAPDILSRGRRRELFLSELVDSDLGALAGIGKLNMQNVRTSIEQWRFLSAQWKYEALETRHHTRMTHVQSLVSVGRQSAEEDSRHVISDELEALEASTDADNEFAMQYHGLDD
eukprot:TRINITY_DN47479_c0_g1_i3.p1 TRINITY_DN47479_c0_g1~~TRINITY_DN47479_c0_g1_i3.p1  ORF type:complete len:1057 (-),score=66.38 TRINITY_DN47479_c0_g1_i3:626-3706(-)